MLTHLKIRNIALVEQADLTFDSGMTVLTGETGAGKSVIVTAIALALGGRADREYIRAGERKGTVEATFDISVMPKQFKKIYADHLDGHQLTVHRKLLANGMSKVRINGIVCSASLLRKITAPLSEILGQHANQMLMNEDNHLLFLDSFADLDESREKLMTLFSRWESVSSELRSIRSRRERLIKERELLLFQREEIDRASITVGEESELLSEKKILDSSRTLMEAASSVQNLLDHEESSALTYLRMAKTEFEKMAAIDDGLQERLREVIDVDYRLEDLRRFIEQYGSSVPDNPARLEEINSRLEELYQLKRKYGGGEDAILETLADINKRLEKRPDIDSQISNLEKENERRRTEYTARAIFLTSARRKAADHLRKLVVKELEELAIDQSSFELQFLYEDDPDGIELDSSRVTAHPHGLETGRFMFSANPGEPLKSLVKTASGGEISRVLLALKSAEMKSSHLRHALLVFDEVDAGIGGQTANEVGKKLKRLAVDCQIIVITHLHQIARLADHHFVAEKKPNTDARTTINVSRLKGDAIVGELDRMIALPEKA
jgi:DNA repair protein RecN (Recombination protein N)